MARSQLPDVWAALSPHVKQDIVASVLEYSEAYIARLMAALQRNILSIMDLKGLMTRIVRDDKQILCDMFLTTGGAEFDFIRRSGFHFGFAFGLVQVPLSPGVVHACRARGAG